jgi:hypothetical protein
MERDMIKRAILSTLAAVFAVGVVMVSASTNANARPCGYYGCYSPAKAPCGYYGCY